MFQNLYSQPRSQGLSSLPPLVIGTETLVAAGHVTIYPSKTGLNLCVYGERFHRLRVDGRPKRIKKFAFTSVCVYNRLRVDGALNSLIGTGN